MATNTDMAKSIYSRLAGKKGNNLNEADQKGEWTGDEKSTKETAPTEATPEQSSGSDINRDFGSWADKYPDQAGYGKDKAYGDWPGVGDEGPNSNIREDMVNAWNDFASGRLGIEDIISMRNRMKQNIKTFGDAGETGQVAANKEAMKWADELLGGQPEGIQQQFNYNFSGEGNSFNYVNPETGEGSPDVPEGAPGTKGGMIGDLTPGADFKNFMRTADPDQIAGYLQAVSMEDQYRGRKKGVELLEGLDTEMKELQETPTLGDEDVDALVNQYRSTMAKSYENERQGLAHALGQRGMEGSGGGAGQNLAAALRFGAQQKVADASLSTRIGAKQMNRADVERMLGSRMGLAGTTANFMAGMGLADVAMPAASMQQNKSQFGQTLAEQQRQFDAQQSGGLESALGAFTGTAAKGLATGGVGLLF